MIVGGLLGFFHRSIIDNTVIIAGVYALGVAVIFAWYFGTQTSEQMLRRLKRPRSPLLRSRCEGKPAHFFPKRFWMNLCGIFQIVVRQPAGVAVALGVAVLIAIASPRIIEYFWRSPAIEGFSLQQCLGLVVGLVTIAGTVARKLLGWGTLGTGIGIAIISSIGLAILWLITLRVATYVYYGTPPTEWRICIPLVFSIGCLVAAIVAMCRFIWRREVLSALAMLLIAICLYGLSCGCMSLATGLTRWSALDKEDLVPLTQSVSRVVQVFSSSENENSRPNELANSFTSPNDIATKDENNAPALETLVVLRRQSSQLGLRNQAGALDDVEHLNRVDYQLAQRFLHNAESLAELTLGEQQEFLNQLSNLCIESLLKRHANVLNLPSNDLQQDQRPTQNSESPTAAETPQSEQSNAPKNQNDWADACHEAIVLEVLREHPELWDLCLDNNNGTLAEADQKRVARYMDAIYRHAKQKWKKTHERRQEKVNRRMNRKRQLQTSL